MIRTFATFVAHNINAAVYTMEVVCFKVITTARGGDSTADRDYRPPPLVPSRNGLLPIRPALPYLLFHILRALRRPCEPDSSRRQ